MSFGSRKEKAENIIADKEFRQFYNETHLKKSIPFQMRTMRAERNLSQTDAAQLLGKGQNALSRLESPAYGRLTLQSLLDIARGYDVGLLVKFVPFSRLLREYEDVSFDALSAPSPTTEFPEELTSINAWIEEVPDSGFWEADEDIEDSVSIAVKDSSDIVGGYEKRPLPKQYLQYLDWKFGGNTGGEVPDYTNKNTTTAREWELT